jgi:hypothetical protein
LLTLLSQTNHARLGTGGPHQAMDGVIDEYGVAMEYHLAENGGDNTVSILPFELVNPLNDERGAESCSSYEQQVKQEVRQVAAELALDISLSMRI